MAAGEIWTSKYAPKSTAQMVGSRYPIEVAKKWLQGWQTQQKKSVLISGPVGCGKTLLARLICAEAALPDVVEINASKSRTKKTIQEMEETFKSNTIRSYFRGGSGKPGCLIVDEVEACDQGGLAQLVSFIKKAKIPVVCTCSDGYKKQLTGLQSVSMQARLSRPSPEQIAPLLCFIAFDQKFSHNFALPRAKSLAAACNCDVRQCIMELQFLQHSLRPPSGFGKLALETTAEGTTCDRELGIFDALGRVFPPGAPPSPEESDRLHSADRSLISALVAENYISVRRLCLSDADRIAEAISLGDVLERRLPGDMQSVFSVAVPAQLAKGRGGIAQSKFPAVFGNTSKAGSNLKEAKITARLYCAKNTAPHELLPGLYACLAVPALRRPTPQIHSAVAAKLRGMGLGAKTAWESICCVGCLRELPPGEKAKLSAVGKLLDAEKKRKKGEEEEEEEEQPKKKIKK